MEKRSSKIKNKKLFGIPPNVLAVVVIVVILVLVFVSLNLLFNISKSGKIGDISGRERPEISRFGIGEPASGTPSDGEEVIIETTEGSEPADDYIINPASSGGVKSDSDSGTDTYSAKTNDYLGTTDDYIRQCPEGPLETSVRTLLDYELNRISINIDDYFCNLGELNNQQRQALNESLNSLQGKNFVIFNKQVEILENESDIQVYNESNLIYLEVFDSNVSKGRILLGDLTELVTLENCDNNDTWQNNVRCIIRNYLRQNPLTPVGEAPDLEQEIRIYLENRFGDFDNNFQIHRNGSVLEVINIDITEEEVKFIYPYIDYYFYVANLTDFLKHYIDGTSRDPEAFLVVDEENFEYMLVSEIRELTEFQESIPPPPALPTLSPRGFIRRIIDFFINLFRGEVTGGIITGLAELEPPGGDPVTCRTEPVCNYTDQEGKSSVLPCDKNILYLEWHPDIVGAVIAWRIAPLKKLAKDLGYNFEAYHNNNANLETIKNKFMEGNAQIVFTGHHGSYEGLISTYFPDMCVLNSKKDELCSGLDLNTWEGRAACRDLVQEYINENYFESTLETCWGLNEDEFDYGLACGVDSFHYPPSPDIIKNRLPEPRAIHGTYGCEAYGRNDYPGVFVVDASEVKVGVWGGEDVWLFTNYLKGNGCEKKELLGWQKCYEKYPPLKSNIADVHTSQVAEGLHASPAPDVLSLDFKCYDKVTKLRVLCSIFPHIHERDVHLFPFVNEFYFEHDYTDKNTNLSIKFSDAVTEPEVKFILEDGTNAIEGLVEFSEDRYKYEISPDVKVLSYTEWWLLNESQKEQVKIGTITVKGSQADVGENDVEMIGNPLAELTEENKAKHPNPEKRLHNIPFFLYDEYFWNYNARYSEKGPHVFTAKVPYMTHPWVTEVNSYSPYYRNHIFVKFSQDVNTDEEACDAPSVNVDFGECALFYDGKPFTNESVKPKFVDNKTIEFTLRDKDTYSRVEFFITPTYNTWGNDAWLMENYGYNKSNWPEKWAVKIKIQNIKSVPNSFPLMGNTESPTFWNYDREGSKEIDAWENNSWKVPQKEGPFEIWIPCIPATSACRVPEEKLDYGGNTYLDYKCEDLTEVQCAAVGGTFHKGLKCLKNYYYGDPTPGGTVNGRAPINCGSGPEAFILEKQTTSSCNPGGNTSNEYHGYTTYKNYGEGMWGAKLGYLDGYDRNYNFLGRNYDFECGTGFFSYGGGISTLNTYPNETDPDAECISVQCGGSGDVTCDGGTLTINCNLPSCSTTTTATFTRICGSGDYNPSGKYVAYYDYATLRTECCDGDEKWDCEENKCVPLSDENYVDC